MIKHIFEFQIFSHFITAFLADRRNSALGKCSGSWLRKFYSSQEAQDIVNHIDSIPNLGNYCYPTIGRPVYLITCVKAYSNDWINRTKKLMIGNAKSVGDTGIERLEKQRSSISQYGTTRGQQLAVYLAIDYRNEVTSRGSTTLFVDIDEIIKALKVSVYPQVKALDLVPHRPICYPDGSYGKIVFYPPNSNSNSQGLRLKVTQMQISDSVLDGTNIKAKMGVKQSSNGWNIMPMQPPHAECQGVYVQYYCAPSARQLDACVSTTTPAGPLCQQLRESKQPKS
ncbi:hypothetical protein B0H10DRAFT_1948496 [Mycena sp. CBHHK59/15]|nr:hypothetical protein B0H10DRAFT_1948496 [Mycena sp. CBHHK59/15]